MTNTQKKTYMGLDPLICEPNTLLHIVLQQLLYLRFLSKGHYFGILSQIDCISNISQWTSPK